MGKSRIAATNSPSPDSVLDKLEQTYVITPDGSDWVRSAMDPFHDFNLLIAGLPDMTSGQSVVRFYKEKITLVRPTSLAATDKWDAHLFTLPLVDSMSIASRSISNRNHIAGYDNSKDIQVEMGTFNAITTPAGGKWFNPTTGLQALEAYSVTPPLKASRRSLARIIGLGFEVHNDTPSLYKGGSVTCYDCPQGDYLPQIFTSAGDCGHSVNPAEPEYGYTCSGPFLTLRRPPDNVSEATQMPGSVTWEAAEGCYVVNKVDLSRSNYIQPSNHPLVFFGQGGEVSGSTTFQKELVSYYARPGAVYHDDGCVAYQGAPGTTLQDDPCYRLTALHTSGAYFNGLSPETVLTIEVHIIVESLPINDRSELALARPAAQYDPAALQLYEKSIRMLKSGVPVHMNAKGDWWKMVGNVLLDAAPSIAGAINPMLGTAVKGLITVGKKAKGSWETAQENKAKSANNARQLKTDNQVNIAPLQPMKPKQPRKPPVQQNTKGKSRKNRSGN